MHPHRKTEGNQDTMFEKERRGWNKVRQDTLDCLTFNQTHNLNHGCFFSLLWGTLTLSFLPSSVLRSEMTSLNLCDLGQGSVGQGSGPVCD